MTSATSAASLSSIAAAGRADDGRRAATTATALRVLALGPVEIHLEGRLLPAFWPEASAARVSNNFHVTLHHLREALRRPDWVIFENERYRINRELGYRFDVADFEAGVLRSLQSREDGAETTELLRNARPEPETVQLFDRLRQAQQI